MVKKTFIMLTLIITLIFPTNIYANNVDVNNYSINKDKLIKQITVTDKSGNIIDVKNQYSLDSFLNRNENLNLESFNKDEKIKSLLSLDGKNIKFLQIPYFKVTKNAKITTLDKNLFLSADRLEYKNREFHLKGEYLFMDGKVVLKHTDNNKKNIIEQKEITTLEEYNMIKNKSLNTDYWNIIEYEKGGMIEFLENGYYLVSLKDNNLNLLDSIVVEVVDKDSIKNITFPDVKKNSWFYQDVTDAVKTGIIVGRDDGKFDPTGNLTIAEAITLSARARSRYEGEQFFEGGLRWYDNAVDYAIKNNIIQIGDFIDYNKKISREEMAYIFSNTMPNNYYKGIPNITIPNDINNSRFKSNIEKLYNSGILKGRDDGKFDPKTNINRAESAVIINRLINN